MVRLSSLVFIVAACLAATTTSGHQIEPALRELAAESPAENRSLWWWSKPQWMKDLDKAISTAVSKAKDVGKHAIAKGKALIGKRRLGTEDEAANNERHLIDGEDEGEAHRRLGFWSWFKKAKADVGNAFKHAGKKVSNAFKHAGKKISDARQSVFKNITVRRDRHGYGRHLEEAANNERHLIDGEDEGEAPNDFWSWFTKTKAQSEANKEYHLQTTIRPSRRGLQEEEDEAANDFWSWLTKSKAQSEANKEYHLQTTIRPTP